MESEQPPELVSADVQMENEEEKKQEVNPETEETKMDSNTQ